MSALSLLEQAVPWPLRVVAQKAGRRLHEAGVRLSSRSHPPPIYRGRALSWHLEEDALEVELFREPCNEIGTTALEELELLADYIRQGAGGARALIFHSSIERGFCAGADLRELHAGIVSRKGEGTTKVQMAFEVRRFLDRIHRAFNTFDAAPMTTIGAIHGVCFGGGFELALTCDILVADKSARFAFPELRLGLLPGFGGIPRLERDLGNAVIRDLLLTGRSLNAQKAKEVGLVSQVVARGEALRVARLVAEQAARFDAQTTKVTKGFLKPIPKARLEKEKDLFIELLGSEVVEAALHKFVHSNDVRPYLP